MVGTERDERRQNESPCCRGASHGEFGAYRPARSTSPVPWRHSRPTDHHDPNDVDRAETNHNGQTGDTDDTETRDHNATSADLDLDFDHATASDNDNNRAPDVHHPSSGRLHRH